MKSRSKKASHPKQSHTAQPIEAVVFDIGKVLLDYDFDLAMRAASRLAKVEPPEIRRRLLSANHFLEFERGKISHHDFHQHVQGMLNHPVPYEIFREIWNGIFTGEIEPTVRIFCALKKRKDLKVGILSNTNVLHFECVRKQMTVLHGMEHVYASHEIGCRKPEAEAFNHVLEKMDVRAERTVFVDDMAENIAAAQALGMHVVHATDTEAVRVGLARYGLE